MGKGYFSLDIRDDNRLTKIFRIIFGMLCCAIAIFWVIYNWISVVFDNRHWITVAFLVAFGIYQIYAGFGLAIKFIELTTGNIRLKKNSILPVTDISSDQIEKIELFPLKVMFYIKSGKKVLLRFGISDPEKVEEIKREIVEFADSNKLILEIVSEEI